MSLITNNERNYIVYCHVFPNNKKYFGITCQGWKKRWGKSGIGYKGQLVYNAIEKYGWYNTTHYILFKDLTEYEAKQKEIDLIARYNTTNRKYGYNVDKGGGDAPTLYGIDNPNSKKIICINTGEIFNCISDACKKYNVCDRCISACCKDTRKTTGVHLDTGERLEWQFYDEWLIKLKQCSKIIQNKKSDEKRVMCIETNKIYNSITDAADSVSVHRTNVSKVCRGIRKTAGGYHWCYIDE